MFSTTTDYAYRGMLCLAQHPNQPMTTEMIAELSGIKSQYLSKVFSELTRSGLITSRRGRGGGFMLSKPASEIMLNEIILAIGRSGSPVAPRYTIEYRRAGSPKKKKIRNQPNYERIVEQFMLDIHQEIQDRLSQSSLEDLLHSKDA